MSLLLSRHTAVIRSFPPCLSFGIGSGGAARDGALPARRPAGAKDPLPATHPAQRGPASDVQHPLLGEGEKSIIWPVDDM